MARIGTIDRLGAARAGLAARGAADRPRAAQPESDTPPSRALVALDGRREQSRPAPRRDGWPDAGFVTQLMLADEPGVRPSRLERTRAATALYAAAARRVA